MLTAHFLAFLAEKPDVSKSNALNTSIASITLQLQTKHVISSEEIKLAEEKSIIYKSMPIGINYLITSYNCVN